MSVRAALSTMLACLVAAQLCLLTGVGRGAVQADGGSSGEDFESRAASGRLNGGIAPNVESQLSQLVQTLESGEPGGAIEAPGAHIEDGLIRVVVCCAERDVPDVMQTAEDNGAVIEATWGGFIQCMAPPEAIENIAATEGVDLVRLPIPSFPCVESEGLGLINATEWQAAGYNGTGIKIGILDSGFSGYEAFLGSELPSSVATRWASTGGAGTSTHGVTCAELVHDVAPGAGLYLARFDGEVDWHVAAQWLIDQGVDVISCSIYWLGAQRDGSSPVCAPIEAARNQGILWAQVAGNSGQRHWMGSWLDTDDDDLHEWSISPLDEANAFGLAAGSSIYISLTWDDTWGEAENDYDLLVFLDGVFASSENDQAGGYPDPHEWVSFTAPVGGTYRIAVVDYLTGRDCTLEAFITASSLEHVVSAGSVCDTGASPYALTVGAVSWEYPDELEFFSSQGPTMDGREKPDLVGPDGVTTASSGGSFYGTSAAAPHVAGAAALVKQAYPAYGADQIQAFLEGNAVDLGSPGKDNEYGSGRLLLPALPDFGDAPDPSYPTLLASNGARHIIVPGFCLGSSVDGDTDGQPNAGATGDDTLDGSDDEDGVVFTSALVAAQQATVNVTASATGFLDAWMDFNGDGDWADTGEQIFVSQALVAGVNHLSFSVPGDMSVTEYTYARFRFSSTGGLSYTGEAEDGEVEDHRRGVSYVTVERPLKQGWNMVSVPVEADDMSVASVFPAAEAIYTWNPATKAYTVPTEIVPEKGYWVAVSSDTIVYVDGAPVASWSHDMRQGWNMVGSIYGESPSIAQPDDTPDGDVEGYAYLWDPVTKSYQYVQTILPGNGYWMAATGDCQLSLAPSA